MKDILIILLIAALTATIYADFLEYTPDNFNNLRLTIPNEKSCYARMINSQAKSELQRKCLKPHEIEFEETVLHYETSNKERDQTICEHFPGVYVHMNQLIGHQQYFCQLKTITMKLSENESGKQFIVLTLLLDSEKTKPFAVHIPILKEPVPIKSLSLEELVKFLDNNKVVIKEPISEKELIRARSTGTFVIELSSLSNLLPRGITRSSTPKSTMPGTNKKVLNYFTQPVVLPKSHMELYADVINSS